MVEAMSDRAGYGRMGEGEGEERVIYWFQKVFWVFLMKAITYPCIFESNANKSNISLQEFFFLVF